MIGGYEPSLVWGIIVMLSVWALFIVYRSLAGRRRKETENGAAEEEDEGKERVKAEREEESRCDPESTDQPKRNGGRVSVSQDNCIAGSRAEEAFPDVPSVAAIVRGARARAPAADEADQLATEACRSSSAPDPTECPSHSPAPGEGAPGPGKKGADYDSDGSPKQEPSCGKTEISIMEATMNDNEWLDGTESRDARDEVDLAGPDAWLNAALEPPQAVPADAGLAGNPSDESRAPSLPESDPVGKKVAAVPPMPQNVGVSFRVHYITQSPSQLLAVTGSHEGLGSWGRYVPLSQDKEGFWGDSIALPADCEVEWKFVLVEDGKICRWEECSNRQLDTGRDVRAHKWWGYL
ncbi:STBD1 protein, partial [Atractosteus spatula]|nr:STBD1 protein [Atractosteus spatula]